MTPQSITTSLKQEILKDFDINFYEGIYSCAESDGEFYDSEKQVKDFLSQAIDRVEEETRKEIIKKLKTIEHQKWDDAIHCTCLPYAISELEIKSLSPNK